MISKLLEHLGPQNCIALGKHNTIQQNFSKIKDEVPYSLNSGTVYKVPCLDSPSVYIGETSELLQKRMS